MKSDIIYTDDGTTLTYFSRSVPSIRVSVPRETIYRASRVADDMRTMYWAWPDLVRFSEGSFDFATVCSAARQLARLARSTAGSPRYRGQSADVEALTEAHRACAAVMRHPDMTDDLDLASELNDSRPTVSLHRVTTDHEVDDAERRDDLRNDARGRGEP